MSYQTIYFDLDGTLTDSGPGIMHAVAYAMQALGRPVPDRREMARYIGPPLHRSFQEYAGMDEATANQAVERFRVYYHRQGKFENRPYPGIPALLARLQAQGKTLAVATSKPEVTAVEILEHFDLARYFAFIAGATMDSSRVAKAMVLAYALEKGGRDRAVMVGDRLHDVQGARENGLPCIGVLYGYGSRRELEEAGADRVASTVAELGRILEE